MQKATRRRDASCKLEVDGEPIALLRRASTSTSCCRRRRASAASRSPPRRTRTDEIELQIRLIPGGQLHDARVHRDEGRRHGCASRGRSARSSCARTATKPIIFVAGATGFAPVKSMVEHAFHIGMKRRMILYWGVRSLRRTCTCPSCREQWAARARELHVRAGALRAAAGGPLDRPHRPRARGDPRRLSRPLRPPDLRLRLGEDGRGRASGVHGARPVAGRLLLRRVPARAAPRAQDRRRGHGASSGGG